MFQSIQFLDQHTGPQDFVNVLAQRWDKDWWILALVLFSLMQSSTSLHASSPSIISFLVFYKHTCSYMPLQVFLNSLLQMQTNRSRALRPFL